MSADPALERLLRASNTAANADRIGFRDQIAAFGLAALDPLVDHIRQGLHPHFAVGVLEAIGRAHPVEASATLRRGARLNPEVRAMAAASVSRLERDRPVARASLPRRSGVLDDVSRSGPPPEQGPCEFLTRAGKPCQNPGRYLRDGRWSYSRNHAL